MEVIAVVAVEDVASDSDGGKEGQRNNKLLHADPSTGVANK